MLELINKMDGFDYRGDVKVVMDKKRIENLDKDLIRNGRIERKIELKIKDEKKKSSIFKINK
jgi:ATP-dependent 26S proteasome regulatory subunit